MTIDELQEIVLKNTAELAELRHLLSKEKRVEKALDSLRCRLASWLEGFHRDKYKSTDQRLLTHALAEEILIFDKLGYDIRSPGAHFALGVASFLEGRNQSALDYFKQFVEATGSDDRNHGNAHYLSAMICYNRGEIPRAISHFEATFRASPQTNRDWQCMIYVAELEFFRRDPPERIEMVLRDVEEGLRSVEDGSQLGLLKATLHLKWGNCCIGHLDREPKRPNLMVNNQLALSHYKEAREALKAARLGADSLLPVIIDYSLAQALLLTGRLVDLSRSPADLFAEVFRSLRRIVLTKREEIILAQSYLMLGTCAIYSSRVSNDAAEIYLEHARNQTLSVPSDVCFYSCMTKELLSRDEFLYQIESYSNQLEQRTARR